MTAWKDKSTHSVQFSLCGVAVVETNNNMKNLHLLPTTKPSVLYEFSGQYHYHPIPQINFRSYHIYITSDEEIKQGDWHINLSTDEIEKASKNLSINWENGWGGIRNQYKKIILTTDQDLIKDGIQGIGHSFLEWFVNNPTCDEVKIESYAIDKEWNETHTQFNPIYPMKNKYKIIIPQEEAKQCKCGSNWVNTTNKDNPFCFHCGKPLTQEPKQETLEEAAEKRYVEGVYVINGIDICDASRECFIAGAKWQSENMPIYIVDVENTYVHIEDGVLIVEKNDKTKRMYSEEDMIAFLDWSKSTNQEKSEYELKCLLAGVVIDSKTLFNIWAKQSKRNNMEQETIEEAAERLYPFALGGIGNVDVDKKNHFIKGAKWQQERMYSEEVAPYKGDLPK
jgi:hypothetical protein